MTNRYALLLDAMQKSAHMVLITFIVAMCILGSRWLVGWLLSPTYVPAWMRYLLSGLYDLCIIAIPLYLMWRMP